MIYTKNHKEYLQLQHIYNDNLAPVDIPYIASIAFHQDYHAVIEPQQLSESHSQCLGAEILRHGANDGKNTNAHLELRPCHNKIILKTND